MTFYFKFFQENSPESVVCEMAAIFSRPQCVNCITVSFSVVYFDEVFHKLRANEIDHGGN